jgi:hypothetical protein
MQMDSTQPNRHIKCSSSVHMRTMNGPSYGNQKSRTNASFSHGCFYKTSYGLQTEFFAMEDKWTIYASSAVHSRKTAMHMLAQCSFTRQLCRSQPENYYAHASPMLVHKANMGTASKLDRDHIAVTTTTDLLPPSKGWWHNSLQTGANAVTEIELHLYSLECTERTMSSYIW